MGVKIKITIDVDNLFWRPFWAFIDDPDVAQIFLINDPKIAHIFLKIFFADTSRDTAILSALTEGRKIGQVEGARTNQEYAAKRRQVIIGLAKEVWERKPDLQNNMLATASEIERKLRQEPWAWDRKV